MQETIVGHKVNEKRQCALLLFHHLPPPQEHQQSALLHVSIRLDPGASWDSSQMNLYQLGTFHSFRGSVTDPAVNAGASGYSPKLHNNHPHIYTASHSLQNLQSFILPTVFILTTIDFFQTSLCPVNSFLFLSQFSQHLSQRIAVRIERAMIDQLYQPLACLMKSVAQWKGCGFRVRQT